MNLHNRTFEADKLIKPLKISKFTKYKVLKILSEIETEYFGFDGVIDKMYKIKVLVSDTRGTREKCIMSGQKKFVQSVKVGKEYLD